MQDECRHGLTWLGNPIALHSGRETLLSWFRHVAVTFAAKTACQCCKAVDIMLYFYKHVHWKYSLEVLDIDRMLKCFG